MTREFVISKLKAELEYLNKQLVRSYSAQALKKWQEVEKEIQVQSAYLKMENK